MTEQKLLTDIQEFLERDTTQNFLTAARQFVELLEMENIDKEDFFKKAHTALIELYASGYKLEEIDLEFENEDVNLKKNLSFENKNVKQIANLEFDTKYWKVFNPINKNIHEPIQGDLALDFEDIYQDLKTELEKMKIGTKEAVGDALWQMKFSFTMHWGNHCIDALRAIHYLLAGQDE
ncbi:MAG: DUF5063 domain-containing protein [Leptospiraceae bacterium]|nr:DUF5063 domain-containing protein [Leptospiraceae bacterium]